MYRVVKFIVNVKLVEKRAKRRVGKVMVVKVMIHISNPGIPLTIAKNVCPSKASHEVGSVVSTRTSNADAAAVIVTVFTAVVMKEFQLSEAATRPS